MILKLDSNFNFIWAKNTFFGESSDSASFVFPNIAFDEDDNIYLTGSFGGKTNNWVDLGNNQRISNSSPYNTYTGFIAKYDTSGTAQWANQIFMKNPSEKIYAPSYYRQSIIQGDTIFVQYNIRGFNKNTETWCFFDSLYTFSYGYPKYDGVWMGTQRICCI